MKHHKTFLALSIILLLSGAFFRFSGAFLMRIVPSMAVADGVADPDRHRYLWLWFIYIILPYIVILIISTFLFIKNRETARFAFFSAVTAFMFPLVTFVILTVVGLTIDRTELFWKIFPLLHFITALIPLCLFFSKKRG